MYARPLAVALLVALAVSCVVLVDMFGRDDKENRNASANFGELSAGMEHVTPMMLSKDQSASASTTHVIVHLPPSTSSNNGEDSESAKKLQRIAHMLGDLKQKVAHLKKALAEGSSRPHDDDDDSHRRRHRVIPHITVYVGAPAPPPPKPRRPAVEGTDSLTKHLQQIFGGFKKALRDAKPTQFWLPREPKKEKGGGGGGGGNGNGNSATNGANSNNKSGGAANGSSGNSASEEKKKKAAAAAKAAKAKKLEKKKQKKCHGKECGPLRLESPKDRMSSSYVITGNNLEIRWAGGGKKSTVKVDLVRYHSTGSVEVTRTLYSGKNTGKFVWKVEDVPASSHYRIRIETTHIGADKKKMCETVRSGLMTLEPASNWGQRGRKRLWRSQGGP